MTTLLETIREALDYAAEDFAERANIESKHRADDGDPDEDSEEAEYIAASDKYSAALAQLPATGAFLVLDADELEWVRNCAGTKLRIHINQQLEAQS